MTSYRRGVFGACALGFAVSWNISNVGAVPGVLAREYGVPLASVALLTSGMFIAELASTLGTGRLIDRLGPKRIGLVSLAVVLLGNAALSFAGHFGAALVLRFVVGAGQGAGFLAGAAYISQLGGSALTQGVYGSISAVAGGVALILVPAVEPALSWRSPFLTGGCVCLGALVILGAGPQTNAAGSEGKRRLKDLMLDGRILRFGAVQSAAFGLGIVLSAWTVELLDRRGDVGAQEAGIAAGLIFIVGIVGRPLGGFVLRRHPEAARRVFVVGMLCGAIGTALLCLAPPYALAVAGGALIGLATGLPFGATMSTLAREFPDAIGSAFAAVNFYAIATVVVLTPVVGLTFANGKSGIAGFALVAVLWVLATFAIPSTDVLTGRRRVPAPVRS